MLVCRLFERVVMCVLFTACLSVAPGEEFAVRVVMSAPVDEVYAAQFDLRYDTDLLDAVRVERGVFLSGDGASTILGAKNILEPRGLVQYGESRAGVKTGVRGEGVLATLVFRAGDEC